MVLDSQLRNQEAQELFKGLKPAEKVEFFKNAYEKANNERSLASRNRSGQTHGFAFLWINLYGKDPVSRAFRRYVKTHMSHDRPIYNNYRGSTHAWYFGSQSDLGFYDGLKAMAKSLGESGIPCFVEDAWD